MTELYIGLMSGTSQDGLDAVLVEFDDGVCSLRAATTTAFPDGLADDLASLVREARIELRALGTLSTRFGEFAAERVLALIATAGIDSRDVRAIGFSGHTIYHQPDPPSAFTLQLGNPNVVAARTGITTVADLRGMDIAMGGQGAPLLPAFHAWRFADPTEARAAVNIGGIANITLLMPGRPVTGFDSGPGNTLMDHWSRQHGRGRFDPDGAWAASGKVVAALLQTLKADAYFTKAPPKSTGLEHFNPTWLTDRLGRHGTAEPADVQATLLELTASTIIDALELQQRGIGRLILCGGGAYNGALVRRLAALAAPTAVVSSTALGIEPEWVEAAGFAWLARARVAGRPGNLPSVTGAREPVQLGGVYSGHKPRA